MQTLTYSVNSTCPELGHILSMYAQFGIPNLQKKHFQSSMGFNRFTPNVSTRYSAVFFSTCYKNHLNTDISWKCVIIGNVNYTRTIYIDREHGTSRESADQFTVIRGQETGFSVLCSGFTCVGAHTPPALRKCSVQHIAHQWTFRTAGLSLIHIVLDEKTASHLRCDNARSRGNLGSVHKTAGPSP